MIVSPSLLSADFGHLADDVEMLNASECQWLHVDVMDGVFVPNISFGFPLMEVFHRYGRKPLDVHLMITHPEKYVERFCDAGAWSVGFHLEAVSSYCREQATPEEGDEVRSILSLIKAKGVKTCLTINPDIPVERLFPYLGEVDMLLLMSVYAGFGGQKFIPETIDKVRALKAEMLRQGATALIEVDGGVNADNAPLLAAAGADAVVAGSSVFRADSPQDMIHTMVNC